MRQILGIVVLLCALGVGSGAALQAQDRREVPPQTINTVDHDRDDGFEWGWVGLLGLVGLAGLMRRESHDRTVVRTTDTRPSTARP